MSITHNTEAQLLMGALHNESKDFKLAYMLTLAHAKTVPSAFSSKDYFAEMLEENLEGVKKVRAKANAESNS